MRTERFLEAEQSYLRALRADPGSGALEMAFARFLERINRLEDAEARLLRAVELDGSARDARLALGRLYERMGKIEAAEAEFRRAANNAPDSSLPRFELARLLERVGRREEARGLAGEAEARLAGESAVLLDGLLLRGPAEADTGRFFSLMDLGF